MSPTWAMRGWLYSDGGGPLAGGWGRTLALWMLAVSSVRSPEPTGEKNGSRMNSLALFQQPLTDIAIASNSGRQKEPHQDFFSPPAAPERKAASLLARSASISLRMAPAALGLSLPKIAAAI